MPERTSHAHGTPSWVDLATDDVAASRRFYGELFGWDFVDEPTDQPGVTYTMANRGGRAVAAIAPTQPGRPVAWQSYVTVDDVDAAAKLVGPAGGSVLMEPFDVMTAGRMAVIADPTGGVLCLWTPKDHIGAQLVNEHGALCWTELVTPDVERATRFYGEVLGWSTQTVPMDGAEYVIVNVGDRGVAGVTPPPAEGIPTHWQVYFAVDNCDESVETALRLGATALGEAIDAPDVGRMAPLRDPQGASFSVIQLEQPGT